MGAGQDAAKVARYQHYVEFAYQQADRAVQRIMDAVGYDSNGNLKRDVMVVSDHGFAPFHTAVNMTNIVNQQILPQVNAALTATSLPTIAASSLRAITSGPAVNVYLNLTGRDTAGTSPQISRQQYLVAQPVIASVLQALQDVNSTYTLGAASVSLFDKVYGRPLSNVSDPNFGLNTSSVIGQDSGDVFALLGLGYNFDGIQSPVVIRQGDTVSPSPILSVPNFYGAHGYDPSLPQMSAIFYAAGPDVGHGVIPVVHNIDIAPTIDAHFGLAPAPTVQGTAINLATPSAQLPNGVASGDTTQTTSVLWTHSYNLGTVTFELATDPGFQNIVAAPTAVVTDPLQPVKVSVAGLTPHTEYYYRATVAGRATAAGRFQTAAGSGTYNGVHFGVSGDIRGELAPYPSIGNADEKNLDFFLEFGDVIYADFPSPDLNKPQATTLADYRIKNNEVYASRYGLNTLADLRASTSILATTDDHEVTDNFAGGATIGSDPRFTGNPTDLINDSTLFENGMQAFQEFNPIRDDVYCATGDPRTAGERALYRFNTYGQDAAVFTLDNRSFRDTELPPVTNPFNPAQVGAFLAGSFNAGRTMLGQAQLAALKNDLLASQNNGITWKFVMTPEAIQNFGVLAGEDRWEGYAAERTQLLKFIHDNHIANVVFVTADLHGTVVNRVSYQEFPGGPQIQTDSFEIITGPVAFDKPFGPTIVDLAAGLGLVTGPQYNFYNSLPEGLAKESFVAGVINPQLTALGYNPISPTANPLPNMQLTQGLYMATAVYGWTEFGVDPDTQKLTVTTWGIDPYSQAQLEANPGAITGRTPRIVGQFVTTPVLPGAAQLVNTDLIVNGTTGNDTIVVAPVLSTNSVGNFTVTINGVSMGTFHPTGRIVANGLAGDDTVSLVGGINFSAWLYGGAGNDRLTGGNGANVLLGGAGNDVLTGGTRRDLLIGGLGIDKLSGNGDEDLLIGGTTSFDNRESALAAIMAGQGFVNTWHLLLFFIGAVVMRGAGCVWHDVTDRDIDAEVERTRSRPIPSGQVSVRAALVFMVGLSLIGLLVLVQFNWATILWAM
ncbi:MAG: alkaline phosphatase D family protein, partial [Planctomycetota bacterium]|nr:alkaline phosphatase D family protein [Planctomycetota bacterium]